MENELYCKLMTEQLGLPDLVEFSIRSIPEQHLNWEEELFTNMHCSSMEELLSLGKSQFDYLEMPNIAPFSKKDDNPLYDHSSIHAGDIVSFYILSRCSEVLFMKRRRPLLSYDRLKRSIFIHRNHVGVLSKRRNQ
tara:strand:+ start:360 stop:767 length:408 start_codon:yes stop_codon:yes gene_type:complete